MTFPDLSGPAVSPVPDVHRAGGRLHTHVQVRWGDLDPYRHLNNVAALRLLEEARVATLWRLGRAGELSTNALTGGPDAAVQTFVVHSEIEYRTAIAFRGEPVRVEVWIGHLGAADVEVAYEIHDPGAVEHGADHPARPAIVATTRLAIIDAASGRPRRIPAQLRAAWEPLLGAPPAFRTRRS